MSKEKPKTKSRVWRWIKLLAVAAGLVSIFLLVAMIRVLVQSQLESYEVPDPMAYFQTDQAGSSDTHAQITEQHASVWIVRRSAFLPIQDLAKVPPALQEAANAYCSDMRDRLDSTAAPLLVAKAPQTINRVHPLSAAAHKSTKLFSTQAAYLNPDFQPAWQDLCLRVSRLLDFRAQGRPDMVTFFDRSGSELKVADRPNAQAVPDPSDLPPEVQDKVLEWNALLTKLSDSLLKAPLAFRQHSFKHGMQGLQDIDQAYASALSEFLPRLVNSGEFIILPDGVKAWFETRSRAELALYVAKEKWISAAWTCHDDLRDKRQFAYYLKKAGWKGRQILAQETLEDKASDLAKSVEDGLRDALRSRRTQSGGL